MNDGYILKNNKKAFTIIELIVVIAVLGILVLLGMPKLTGYVQKAQLVRIQHDVKIMQDKMEETLSDTKANFNEWDNNAKDLGTLIMKKQLFETAGLAKKVDNSHIKYPSFNLSSAYNKLGTGGTLITNNEVYNGYKIIPDLYKTSIGTRLKGTFYSNVQGKVYYEPNKPIKAGNKEILPNCVAADTLDYEFEHTTGTIVKYNGTKQYLVIPEAFLVEGKCWPVRIIGKGAFARNMPKIITVKIPQGIEKIEEDAFAGNEIVDVIIPSGVKDIGSNAFNDNNIGQGGVVVKGPEGSVNIGSNAFGLGVNPVYKPVTDKDLGIIIKPNINSDGNIITGTGGRPTGSISGRYTGGSSTGGSSSSGGSSTGGSSSSGVNSSTGKVVVIPDIIAVDGVEVEIVKIEQGAFQGEGLIQVTLPSGLERIEDYAFAGNQLIGINIPQKIKYIGNYAFGFNELNDGNGKYEATIGTVIIRGTEQIANINKKVGNIENGGVKVDKLYNEVDLLAHIFALSNYHVISDEYNPVINPANPGLPTEPEPETGKSIYTKEEIEALKVQGYIEVKTAEELNSVRNNLSGKYIQTQDIDLSTITNFEPIGNNSTKFTGIYDGGGVKIINLTIDKPTEDYVGLFGYTQGAIIKNVALEDINVTGRTYTGGLVGLASGGTISNSYTTGKVTGSYAVGGLVGYANSYSTIIDSYATGSVTGSNCVGGLVGIAYDRSTISNSYATGSVSGITEVGGLVGWANKSNISNSYATGSVTGSQHVGGLVGYAGSSTTISNSYATGSVTGNAYVGGLVGYANGSTISNSYATGSVTGSQHAGGLVGQAVNGSTVTNSYWDKETTKQTKSAGGTRKTTEEMKKQGTYSGWDFNTSWQIDEGNDYPTFQWQK